MALLVSLHTTLTILCDVKKAFKRFLFLSIFNVFHLTTCRLPSLITHVDHHFPTSYLTAAVFSTGFRDPIQRTASTTDIRWSVQRTMMNNPRSYSSSMKKLTRHNHRQTIPLTQCRHNQLPTLQPHNPHNQLPLTFRLTNRFGPKFTPFNHHML